MGGGGRIVADCKQEASRGAGSWRKLATNNVSRAVWYRITRAACLALDEKKEKEGNSSM